MYVTTGLYASKFGIFTHSEEQIRESIDYIIGRWLKDRGGKSSFEEKDIIESLNGFLLQNENRFHNWNFPNGTVANCLGYKKNEQFNIIYYVIPALFKKEFCNDYLGSNHKLIRKFLQENQIIESYTDSRDPYIKLPNGNRQRLVKIVRKLEN